MASSMLKDVVVGVLCIQGAFIEHIRKLEEIKERMKSQFSLLIREIRKPDQLDEIDGLIIPGGESTTLSVFLSKNEFNEHLKKWMSTNVVVWGTCAGLILLSDKLQSQKIGGQVKLGGLPVEATRNLFGRQLNSFEASVELQEPELQNCLKEEGPKMSHGVFIRAPGINRILLPDVKILGQLCDTDRTVVAVQYKNMIATCFHPELTDDLRWHLYFINCIMRTKL